MNFTFTQAEHMLEEASALFECYLDRIYEAENVSDLIGASHWYNNAFISLLATPLSQR